MLSLVLAALTCSHVSMPFVGTICAPDDGKKHAAMILLGGSEGGDSMGGAANAFARHGYVTASVAYFGVPGTPSSLVSIPVETVKHAIDALQARRDVDPRKLGILGISKGGEFALLAASTYPQIDAVVAVVPAPFAFMGLGPNDTEGCSWSKNGHDVACIQPDGLAAMQVGSAIASGKPVAFKSFYEASREADPAATIAATFPLEKVRGPVFCLGAGDDQVWDSAMYCDITMRDLRTRHHAYADDEKIYPGAGHLFLFATHGPSSAITTTPMGNMTILFGGTPKVDASAGPDAWNRIWTFFRAAFG